MLRLPHLDWIHLLLQLGLLGLTGYAQADVCFVHC